MRIPLAIEEADLKEVLEFILEKSNQFANEALKCAYVSRDEEIQNLLSRESIERYLAITKAICFPLKDYDYEYRNLFGETEPKEELGRLMQSWITLGASVEDALQIFLAIHLSNYKELEWGKWDNFNFSNVKNQLLEALNIAKDSGYINQNNKDTLKKVIKDFLKSKQETTHLEQLNLNSLVAFYDTNVWMKDKDEYTSELNIIREYRNCIHPFKKRDIGEWERLLNSLKFYCVLLSDLYIMTPDVNDFLQYEMDVRAEMESYY